MSLDNSQMPVQTDGTPAGAGDKITMHCEKLHMSTYLQRTNDHV